MDGPRGRTRSEVPEVTALGHPPHPLGGPRRITGDDPPEAGRNRPAQTGRHRISHTLTLHQVRAYRTLGRDAHPPNDESAP